MQRFTDSIAGITGNGEATHKGTHTLMGIAGLFFAAYIITAVVLGMDLYFVSLLGLAVASAIILTQRFEFGFLAYALIAPFNRGGSPAVMGAQASYHAGIMPSQLGLVVLCAFWAASRIFGKSQKLVKTELDTPVMVFFGVAVASMIASMFVWDPQVQHYDKQLLFQASEVGMWVLCVLSFYLVAHGGARADWISALFWPVALLGIYVAVFQFAGVIEPWRIVRAGFMPAYAAIMAAARLFMGKDRGGVKFLVFVVFAVNMIAVFDARSWVSGWLTAAIGVMVVILFCSRKAFFAIAAAGLLGLVIFPSFVNNVYDVSRHEGDMDRFTIWADSARMAGLNNPVLGIGPGDYLTYSRKYASVWYGNTTYTNAHSSYAQAVAELGIFGIAALIWLAVAGVKTGISATRRSRADLKWFAAGATGVFASIAVTSVVGDYLLPSRVNGAIWTFGTSAYPWVLLGGAVALARISGSEQAVEEEPCEELLRQI